MCGDGRLEIVGISKPLGFFSLKTSLWLFNVAMENGPFIDYFPIQTTIYKGFSMAMLNNQMVFFDIFCIPTWASQLLKQENM